MEIHIFLLDYWMAVRNKALYPEMYMSIDS